MPTLDVEFEAFCAKCGWPMGGNVDTRTSRTRRIPQITVAPCEKCLSEANNEGYKDGYNRGCERAAGGAE
jgi:hypothetical protein